MDRSPQSFGWTIPSGSAGREAEEEQGRKEPSRQPAPEDMPGNAEVNVFEFRNVRLATFWRNRPKLWFAQLESEFTAYRVRTDDTKYSAVIRHLDEQTMIAVADILEQPPAQNKYEMLKNTLISRFSVSQEKQLRTLLGAMELGNKTPSTLLREMRTLAGTDATDTMLRTLWMQRLPQRIQELLAVLEDVNLDKIAACADKAMERYADPIVSAVTYETQADAVTLLTERCRRLEIEMATGRSRSKESRINRAQRNTRLRSNSRRRIVNKEAEGYCFYHRRFGAKAWRCVIPCKAPYQLANQGNANYRQRQEP